MELDGTVLIELAHYKMLFLIPAQAGISYLT